MYFQEGIQLPGQTDVLNGNLRVIFFSSWLQSWLMILAVLLLVGRSLINKLLKMKPHNEGEDMKCQEILFVLNDRLI